MFVVSRQSRFHLRSKSCHEFQRVWSRNVSQHCFAMRNHTTNIYLCIYPGEIPPASAVFGHFPIPSGLKVYFPPPCDLNLMLIYYCHGLMAWRQRWQWKRRGDTITSRCVGGKKTLGRPTRHSINQLPPLSPPKCRFIFSQRFSLQLKLHKCQVQNELELKMIYFYFFLQKSSTWAASKFSFKAAWARSTAEKSCT